MESFRPQPAEYCIKYDASLTGLGVGLYRISDSALITYTELDIPFDVTNESKRQNTMEFLAVILGLLLAWRSNVRNFHYQLHGDSISSLAWAKADRVNSTLARRANIVFTTITVHVPGTLNVIFDGLSSGLSPVELGLDPTLCYNTATDAGIIQLIMLCDPSLELTNMSSHTDLLRQCTSELT